MEIPLNGEIPLNEEIPLNGEMTPLDGGG